MRSTPGDFSREARKLTQADAGGDIAQTIVIADGGMLIVGREIKRLGGEQGGLLREGGVIRDQSRARLEPVKPAPPVINNFVNYYLPR